jgi:putative transposase
VDTPNGAKMREECSMAKRKRRSFTPEFKAEAVRLCQLGDRTVGQVAKDLDLTETALRDWVKRADIDTGQGPPGALTTAEREELTRLRRENKRLQMEREILKKSGGLLREGDDVKFAFIRVERAQYPIGVLCDVLDVSRSGFYASSKRVASARRTSDARLVVEIRIIHKRLRGIYGSPRVHRELRAKGHRVGKKRVERLMREIGLQGRQKRRFRRTTDSNHAQPIAPNILERNFAAEQPNDAWVTDVTYVATGEGWLYLAVILDLFSRRVVGWATSSTNDRVLALAALTAAVSARRPLAGLVHHSDRGSPYASEDYREALRTRGIVASMSRKGDCYDNAVAESFFASLRAELLDHERLETRDNAVDALTDYIERFYNTVRRHSYLDYVSPLEFELKRLTAREVA